MRKLLLISFFILSASKSFAYGSAGCDSTTVLLMHMDGDNNSTSFTDEACSGRNRKSITAGTNAKLSITQRQFGPTSGSFDASAGNNLNITNTPDFRFGTGDFEIDFWIYFNTISGDENFFVENIAVPDFLFKYDTADGQFKLFLNGALVKNVSQSLSAGTWNHIVCSRTDGFIRFFLNGSQISTPTSNASNLTSSATVYIMGDSLNQGTVNGFVDEYRVSKGDGKYRDNFPVPTTPYCQGCENTGVFE